MMCNKYFKAIGRKIIVLGSLFLCACASQTGVPQPLNTPKPFHPVNVCGVQNLPINFTRVAVLPLNYEEPNAAFLVDLDKIFIEELLKKTRFEVVGVDRAWMFQHAGTLSVASIEKIPSDLFQDLKNTWAVDGVLLTDLTTYRPYKPLAMGVRSKLIQLKDGAYYPLWSCDTLFDAGVDGVEYGACVFQRHMGKYEFPIDTSATILQSPTQFAHYVAFEVFQSLPQCTKNAK